MPSPCCNQGVDFPPPRSISHWGSAHVRVALHIDPSKLSELLGVWVAPTGAEGYPRRFYSRAASAEVIARGTSWMDLKPTEEPWPRFFEYLAEKLPYSVYWSYLDVDEADDLEALFVRLASEVIASAVALEGKKSGRWTVKMLTDDERLRLLGVGDPAAVAHAIGGPETPFRPERRPQRLSSLLAYFADDDTLLVVARRSGHPADADLALAHGLAYREDRDLWLALPRSAAEATLMRAPWITPPIRIWTYGDADAAEEVVRAPVEVLASYDDAFETKAAQLGERELWIVPLVEWAGSAPALEPAHRSQYLAWHCAGRAVLKITRTRHGLKVLGGVDAKNPTAGREPAEVNLTGPIEPSDLHRVIGAASIAAADRLDGLDAAHEEHRLQALLTKDDLGLVSMQREFPAWRPTGGRGFIDFLGVDGHARVHIVETKIGPDDLMVLQGLDYWIWANAHREDIREHFKLPREPRFVIDYIIADKKRVVDNISVYTAAQAEALDGSVAWRFHDATGWRDGKRPRALPFFTVPPSTRRAGDVPARWAKRLDAHLATHAQEQAWHLTRARRFDDARRGLIGSAHAVYDSLAERGLLHSHVAHLRSSQAFALNLFAALDGEALRSLWSGRLGAQVVDVDPPEFEYTDPADELAEATDASPHATQVDVLLRARDEAGATHIALIEVKLSEDDFGGCSAYLSHRNTRRHICRQPGWFGGDPQGCFQLSNHDREHRRRYDQFLDTSGNIPAPTGCWLRLGANQVMRNVALAGVLLQRGEAATATVTLMAPEQHAHIWRRWAENSDRFLKGNGLYFASLPASVVLQFHPLEQAEQLAARYLLDSSPASKRHTCGTYQAELDERFPRGARYIAFESSGNEMHWMYDPRPLITDLTGDGKAIVSVEGHPAGPLTFGVDPARIHDLPSDGTAVLELRPAPEQRVLTGDLSGVEPDWISRRQHVKTPVDFAPLD